MVHATQINPVFPAYSCGDFGVSRSEFEFIVSPNSPSSTNWKAIKAGVAWIPRTCLPMIMIRNEVGEGVNTAMAPLPLSATKMGSLLQRLATGPSIESKSATSGEFDQLGWKAVPEVSGDAIGKLRSIDPQDLGAVLRALEIGQLKLKPSRSEKQNLSPTEPKASHPFVSAATAAQGDEVPTEPNTVLTQPITTSSASEGGRPTVPEVPPAACSSEPDSSTS
ncbi:hypothetical protein BDV38DRAFT_288372 [Aspergillus pseudotamarii]|uniref:Uncharacterized protein n=1 Tax=Aspergillus pseudotamarii TaxID=132259 RepID=A0A5N6SDN8_ASPPS|nr:uncharacterized protein BDV38DRAFT_288372 [Aspergillus pseudotamarii]KAE8131791.1 hypothetical protein BDV38DRAFT_288372 [Aspergillus pseudotamarii]